MNGFFSANNPSLETIPTNKMTMWDLGVGINYNTSSGQSNDVTYVIGVSGYHLTQPQFTYFQIPGVNQNMRWNANAAVAFNINNTLSSQVQVNYALQGPFSEIMIGSLFSWLQSPGPKPLYTLTGGLFYRFQDAIIPVVKLKYKNTSVAASYDVNTSTLKQASKLRGGYEMTFSITGDFTNKSGILKKTVCPKF